MASSDEYKDQKEKLLDLVRKSGATFLRDQFDRPYARIRETDHWQIHPCGSRSFKIWLAGLGYRGGAGAISKENLGAVLNILEARAHFQGEKHELHNRVAWHEGAIYYDLADSKWRAVKITKEGWEVVNDPPILFRRYTHQAPQVEPVRGGKLEDLLRFLPFADRNQQILAAGHIGTSLHPLIAHPVAVFYGDQGAGKTTTMRMWRRLIDPSQTETLTLPTSQQEFIQQLSHHWAPFYDNLSRIQDWQSDLLCQAVTGGGFSKRQLYTDDEDVIVKFRRCIGLNGIDLVVARPDLMDRSILYRFERIPSSQRRTDEDLSAEFEEALPSLFGALLQSLFCAINAQPILKPKDLPRMADFASWAMWFAPFVNATPEEFLEAYSKNRSGQNEEILVSDPVGTLTCAFMDGKDTWQGTPTDLLGEIRELAGSKGIGKAELPTGANGLTRKLNRLSPNLAAAGIRVTSTRTSMERRIVLEKVSP